MAELNIIRPPTKEEQRSMIVIGKKTPQAEFTEKLHKEKTKAGKKELPFADQVAMEDWSEHHRQESRRLILKYGKGYLTEEAVKEYKHPALDWTSYSNLDNFELVTEKEMKDDDLSKRHNLPVKRKLRVYKYKNYNKQYTIMDSEQEALIEAKKKHDAIWESKNKIKSKEKEK